MAISAFDAMHDALEICSGLGFEMGPGFSTHWPMGAETLIKLGHPEIVHEWATQYPLKRKHLPLPDPVAAIDVADEGAWKSALGAFSRRTDWQLLFERELAEVPWQDVLVKWWPRLIRGVAAGLTHGLIRTTHAVRSFELSGGKPTQLQLRELAMGLAYWAAMYVEQPGPPVLAGGERLPHIIASIPRIGADAPVSMREKGLFLHMPSISGWGTAVSRLTVPQDVHVALSDLTTAFIQVNLAHNKGFLIPLVHTVSAPAAVRLMLRHLPADQHWASFIAIWQSNAALLATFAPPLAGETEVSTVPSDHQGLSTHELAERAVEHGDEHAMKFTEACLREFALRPDPRFLLAAEEIQGRLPRFFRKPKR